MPTLNAAVTHPVSLNSCELVVKAWCSQACSAAGRQCVGCLDKPLHTTRFLLSQALGWVLLLHRVHVGSLSAEPWQPLPSAARGKWLDLASSSKALLKAIMWQEMGIVLLDSPRVYIYFLNHLGWEKHLYKEECHDSLSKATEIQSNQKRVNSTATPPQYSRISKYRIPFRFGCPFLLS